MSVSDKGDNCHTLLRVRAAFVGKGSNLHAWCQAEGVDYHNVRKALSGQWKGPKAFSLVEKAKAAAGVAPDATPDAVLAAIMDMKSALAKIMGKDDMTGATMAELASGAVVPDPAKYVPIATVQAMLTERNANIATMSEGRAAEKVADATRKGYLSPAMKEWATGLCQSDEASFDQFIAKSIPQFAHLMQPSKVTGIPPTARGPSTAESEAAAAICAQLGLKPDALNS